MNPIHELSVTVHAILYLIVIGIIGYILYYCVRHAYPRVFQFGHTESAFDQFMQDYVSKVVGYAKSLQLESGSGAAFLDAYKKNFQVDLTNTTDCSINGAIHLYVTFAFYLDIKDARNKTATGLAYNVLKDFPGILQPALNSLVSLYDPNSNAHQDLTDDAWNSLQEVQKAFDAFRQDVGAKAQSIDGKSPDGEKSSIEFIMANTYLNTYFDGGIEHNNIQRMYQMRQIGGFPNFSIFKIYVGDYASYIFDEQIKHKIWGPFSSDVLAAIDTVNNFLTSDAIMNWFTNLPSTIAGKGGDRYENSKQKKEPFVDFKEHFIDLVKRKVKTLNPYADDTKENFVQYLIKIAKTFVALFDVVTAIVNVITDPFAFIKYLLGCIIAILLYITYIVLIAMQVGTVIAFIWIVTVKVSISIVFTVLFAIFAIIYGILSIIDMPLGGFIMRSLRCENLPDAWSRVSNWHKGNRFTRTFFCSRQCRDNFYPSSLFCMKQNADEPSLAPQQILYNIYENNKYLENLKIKLQYGRNPDMNYFIKLTEQQKKDVWGTVYDAQLQYANSTESGYQAYDNLGKQVCMYYFTHPLSSDASDPNQMKLMSLCQNSYCGGGTTAFNFCASTEPPIAPTETLPPKDIVKMITFALLAIISLSVFLWFIARRKGVRDLVEEGAIKSAKKSTDWISKLFGLFKPGMFGK